MDPNQNAPTKGSWEQDWEAATAKAAAYEESQNAKKSADAGANKDGAKEPEASGGEEGVQGAEDDQSGQIEQPEGSGEGSGSGDDDERQREASQQGRPEQVDRAARIARLKADAKELGWEVEANAVTVADRARFREEKRTFRQKLQAEAEEARAYLESEARKHGEGVQRAQKLQEAIDNNDLDGVARAIGRGSWNELTDEAFRRQMSPEHKELMELRRQRAEGERIRKQQAAEAETAARAREAHMQRQKYEKELASQIGALKDPVLAAFADDPMFVQGVMHYQQQEWDGEETISVQEAAKKALADAQAVHDKLSKRLGARAAPKPETQVPTSEATNAEQQRRKSPKNVSQREASDASANADGEFDEKAWTKKWSAQLKTSHPDN